MKSTPCALLLLILFVSWRADKKERAFVNNINYLLANDNVPFNCSIGDMTGYEFGQRTSVPYDSLPAAAECSGATVRYWWVELYKSKFVNRVYSFFNTKGLSDKILTGSYIVYCFHNNKLDRISLRIFTEPKDIKLFYAALGQDMVRYPKEYATNDGEYYYATGTSLKGESVEITLMDKDGFDICTGDWWHRK